MRRQYYANVAQIDEWVGRIVDAAESRFGDNVAVIFTADHGEMLGNHGIWGKNNCAYEEVWGIPLLVRLPSGASPEGAPTAGVSEDAVVVDTPGEPSMPESSVRVAVNGDTRRLDEQSPLVEGMLASQRVQWRFGVYAPAEHVPEVAAAAERELGLASVGDPAE